MAGQGMEGCRNQTFGSPSSDKSVNQTADITRRIQ